MLGKKIKVCSKNPMTGFYRDGYCMTGSDDSGTHTVCAKMDKKFLDYTAKKGNDLSSVVEPGDKWCLCNIDGKKHLKMVLLRRLYKMLQICEQKAVIRNQIKSQNKMKTKGRTKKQTKTKPVFKVVILRVVVSGVYKNHLMVLKV